MAVDQILAVAAFVGTDTSDPNASEIDYYKDPRNHAAACASILDFCRYRVNWNPQNSNESTLNEYLRQVSTFPGFVMESQNDISYQAKAAEWNVYMRSLADTLEKNEQVPAASISKQLADLATVIGQNVRTPLLFLQIIRQDDRGVSFSLYRTQLAISHASNSTISVTNESGTISASTFRVISNMLVANAEKFAEYFREISVDQWRQENTTSRQQILTPA